MSDQETSGTKDAIIEAPSYHIEERRSVDSIIGQLNEVRLLFKRAMREDVHYGVIPGTGSKPTLLKPGAELVLAMMKLRPTVDRHNIEIEDHPELSHGLESVHRTYTVTCPVHNQFGEIVGSGVGSCSTLQSKYRYRWDDTGEPVPKEYWDTRDPAILGGMHMKPRKVGGNWRVFQRVPHDNPSDYYNTALKMAKKCALVDAALTCGAVSEMFTQDVEDMRDLIQGQVETKAPPKRPEPQRKSEAPKPPPEPDNSNDERNEDLPNPFTGFIEEITTATGQKDGKEWTRYHVMVRQGQEDEVHEFRTFSDTHADLAFSAEKQGRSVEITYKKDRWGRKIEMIDLADPGDVPF
jgi:hypothetical protein